MLFLFFFGSFTLSIAQWQPIPSNTTSNLVDICFANDSTGFILSSIGVVLKTTDRGNQWSLSASLPASNTFRVITNVGNDTIYAAGDGIYRSCDGGATWQIFVNPGLLISYLHYFSSLKGIFTQPHLDYCNDGLFFASVHRDYIGTIFNADTSTQISLSSGGYLSPLFIFSDSLVFSTKYVQDIIPYHCSLSSSGGYSLLKSNDQGQNWSSVFQYFNSFQRYPSFINKDTAFFVSNASIEKTTNGGGNIQLIGNFPYIDIINQAMFINDSIGYIIGKNIYKIRPYVLNWTIEYSGNLNLSKIYKAPNGNVFVIGENGIILKENPNYINTVVPFYQNQSFAISPNPATTKITITTSNSFSEETNISIFSLNGEKILYNTFQGQDQIDLDVSTLRAGLYLLKIQTPSGVECKKLVIE